MYNDLKIKTPHKLSIDKKMNEKNDIAKNKYQNEEKLESHFRTK